MLSVLTPEKACVRLRCRVSELFKSETVDTIAAAVQQLNASSFYKYAAPGYRNVMVVILQASIDIGNGMAPFKSASSSWMEGGPTDAATQSFRSAAMIGCANLCRFTTEDNATLSGQEALDAMVKQVVTKAAKDGEDAIELKDLRGVQMWSYMVPAGEKKILADLTHKATQRALAILRKPGEEAVAMPVGAMPPPKATPQKRAPKRKHSFDIANDSLTSPQSATKTTKILSVEEALMAVVKI